MNSFRLCLLESVLCFPFSKLGSLDLVDRVQQSLLPILCMTVTLPRYCCLESGFLFGLVWFSLVGWLFVLFCSSGSESSQDPARKHAHQVPFSELRLPTLICHSCCFFSHGGFFPPVLWVFFSPYVFFVIVGFLFSLLCFLAAFLFWALVHSLYIYPVRLH